MVEDRCRICQKVINQGYDNYAEFCSFECSCRHTLRVEICHIENAHYIKEKLREANVEA